MGIKHEQLLERGYKRRYENMREAEYERMLSSRVMLVATYYKGADSWRLMLMTQSNPENKERPIFGEVKSCKAKSFEEAYNETISWFYANKLS